MAHACCVFEPFSVFILEDNILHVSELILFSNKLSNCTGFSSDLSSVSSHPLRLSSERNSGAADKNTKTSAGISMATKKLQRSVQTLFV